MKQQFDDDGHFDHNLKQITETQSQKIQKYMEFLSIQDYSIIKSKRQQLLTLLPSEISKDKFNISKQDNEYFHNIFFVIKFQKLRNQYQIDPSYDRQSQFAQNLIVRVIKHSPNFEIVDLQVKIGYFLFHKISVFYAKREKSETHYQQSDLKGGFCTVYKCQFEGIFLAFKCFQKLKQEQTEEKDGSILGKALEEYCILKLASFFKVGPKIYDSFGYDIIVYPDCIEFCMELCSPLPKMGELTRKRIAKQLRENLLKLHSLSIIHFDIKAENIAFSNFLNRYVFIDFGMGKIIKETIGFKSITTYRGTFNYCSDQMAQLFFLGVNTKRRIDIFFNDLVALKKTLKNVEFRNQICDNQFYHAGNEQLQQNTLVKDLTKKHRTIALKYNIYHKTYDSLTKIVNLLQLQEINEIITFIQIIKGCFFDKSKERQLIKIMGNFGFFEKYSLNNINCHQLVHRQRVKAQISSEISKINKPCIVPLYLNLFHQKFSQLLQLLRDPVATARIQVLDYCCLLAKVIQVNATTLSLQELQQICEVGKERLKEVKESLPKNGIQVNREENREEKNNIVFETSKTLFALAFHNKLIGKYFSVFCSIVNNIFFFELLSEEQLISYYKVLLQMKIPFENKVVSLIKYNSALVWFYMGTSSQDIYQSLKKKIEQMNEIYCFQASNYHKTEEIQILKRILLKNVNNQAFSNTLGFRKENLLQITIYCQFCKIHLYNIQQDKFQTLRNLQYQLSFYSSSVFQYYDFVFVFQSILQQKSNLTKQICSSLFLKKKNAPFGCLIKIIILFQRDRNIEKIINSILSLKDCKHQFIIRIIIYIMNRIYFYKYELSISKYSVLQLFFNLWIRFSSLFVRQNFPKQSFQHRCQVLLQKVFWQNKIKRLFFYMTDQPLRIIIEKQPYQNYLTLQADLRNNISKSNMRNNNEQLMKWNIFVIMLLTQKRKFQQALRLARIMQRLTNFIEVDFIDKEFVLYIMIKFIFKNENFQKIQEVKENRGIYFQYAKIIENKKKEQQYIVHGQNFLNILIIMYKYKPKGLFPIISKTLAKIHNHNNRRKTDSIIEVFQFLYRFICKQKYFIEANRILQKEIKIIENPYKVIVFFFIIKNKNPQGISKTDFFYIFSLLEKVNYTTKQYFCRQLYFAFLASHCKQIKQRKRNQLNKKIVQYDLLNLSTKQMIKLFISPKSLKSLKTQLNYYKFEKYFTILDNYKKNTYQTKHFYILKMRISYRMILMKLNSNCLQK